MRDFAVTSFLVCSMWMATACGSPAGAGATANGTLGGKPFTAGSAELVYYPDEQELGPFVVISSGSSASCVSGVLNDTEFLASSTVVQIFISNGESFVEPGVYTVSGVQQVARANFFTNDAACNPDARVTATSGTVTLTALSAADVSGSYSFAFPNGDAVSGTFSLPACIFSTAHQADGGDGQSCR